VSVTLLSRADEDRAVAERVHTAAMARWRAVLRAEDALNSRGALLAEDGEETPLDPIERDILSAELQKEHAAAALSLRDARQEFRAARIAHAHDLLPGLHAEYDAAVAEVEDAVRGFENAHAQLLVASWQLGEALAPEGEISRRIYKLATDVCEGDERERLRLELRHRIPVTFDDGARPVDWKARVRGHVFGGGSHSDPGNPELWNNLGEVARRPRDWGLASLGKNVRERVQRIIERESRGSK